MSLTSAMNLADSMGDCLSGNTTVRNMGQEECQMGRNMPKLYWLLERQTSDESAMWK